MNKIILIQIWLGEIPDYFWTHYETTKNINGIDFLFVTDQDIILDSKNYKVVKTTKEEIEMKISNKLNKNIKLNNNKKTCDLKSSLGDLFFEYIDIYDYFGWYDIDTLFGDVIKYISSYLDQYDFISIGGKQFHNRLGGPFTIVKNTEELRNLYKSGDYTKCMLSDHVECYEEHTLSDLVKEKYKFKIINSFNIEEVNGGKNTYDVCWSGGKIYINNDEKMFYHFYRKNNTTFTKIGNQIFGRYDKPIIDDFIWVVHFSENYSKLANNLFESILKYSNRKCLIYTINFNYQLPNRFISSEQFILRRIDIPEGKKDCSGKDSSIMNLKPLILLDATTTYPDKKIIHIDTDIYLTVNSDNITKYFENLENYPLINSHIHDVVYLRNIVPNIEWSSPIHILLDEMSVNKQPVSPRRKCNIILFDNNSEWFLREQIGIYNQFKDSEVPGILLMHDEDTANALLTKLDLKKCLPLIDIEESYNTNDASKFMDLNHPFHMTNISENVKLPTHQNDILFFHNFKNNEDYDKIRQDYGNSVIDCEEILVYYKDNTIFFEKNSFLTTKKIDENVDFIVKNIHGDIVIQLGNQELWRFFTFYVSDIHLNDGLYHVEIVKTNSRTKIYNNLLVV